MFTSPMRFDLGEDIAALRDMVSRWAAERLKPIANGAYWRNKILARQPAIDAIKPTLAD